MAQSTLIIQSSFSLALGLVSSVLISCGYLISTPASLSLPTGTEFIYVGDPDKVTAADVAIALATLQVDPKTAERISARANELLDSPGLITATSLNPLPTAANSNFVDVGPGPFNVVDIAAILARLQVGPDPILMVDRINELLDTPGWVIPEHLTRIPGNEAGSTTCTEGKQLSGANYRVCLPSHWNGELVVFAHGYRSIFNPLDLADGFADFEVPLSEFFPSLDYGFATTSYSKNGLAIDDQIADLIDVIAIFEQEFSLPQRVYLFGVSYGASVAMLAQEQFPESADGILALCGAVNSYRTELDYFANFRVLFDYFYPDLLPGDATFFPPAQIINIPSQYAPQVAEALETQPDRAAQLFTVAGVATDPEDPSTILDAATKVLGGHISVASGDILLNLGGQVFDNQTTEYRGSSNDATLNTEIDRFTANPQALQTLIDKFEPTGQLSVPVTLLHTTLDPTVPFTQALEFEQKVADNNAQDLLQIIPVERYGHCVFTPEELESSLRLLVEAVRSLDP